MTVILPWVEAARRDIGQRETLGPNDSPWIRAMLADLGQSWLVGQPWCGGAMAKWAKAGGFALPRAWWRARAWAEWGQPLPSPVFGAIAVFDRKGGGHVGIVTGRTASGGLVILGGNQGDEVNEREFPASRRPIAQRWPPGLLLPIPSLPPIAAASRRQSDGGGPGHPHRELPTWAAAMISEARDDSPTWRGAHAARKVRAPK